MPPTRPAQRPIPVLDPVRATTVDGVSDASQAPRVDDRSDDAPGGGAVQPDATAATHLREQLIGLSTAAQLSGFAELSAGATLAADPATRVAISRLAVAQFAAVERGVAEVTDRGAQLSDVVGSVREVFDAFHRNTRAANLRQLLVKAWVCAGIAGDVQAMLAERLDADLVSGVDEVLATQRQVAWFAEQQLRSWVADDQEAADAASLFARRVLGEASAQAQRLASGSPELMALVTGESAGSVDEVRASTQLIAELIELSASRMLALGLQP